LDLIGKDQSQLAHYVQY